MPLGAAPVRRSAKVWVVEDDAGYSGDIASFLAAYQPPGPFERPSLPRSDRSDLLCHGHSLADPSWVWYDVVSAPLRDRPRYRCSEHVLRLSAQLLNALEAFATRGLSAWSELLPTLCEAAGLRQGALQERHLGYVYRFDGKARRRTRKRPSE